MRRQQIADAVEQKDLLGQIDISDVAKEAKLGWLKVILIKAVWPIIKPLLAKRLNPVIVDLIDNVLLSL